MKKQKYRNGIFIVTYRITEGKPEYLILKRKLHWNGWEFPKGGIKKFESDRRTVKRELLEETGLKPLKIISLKEKGKYNYTHKFLDRKNITGQTYSLFAAEVEKGKVKISTIEHSDYKWVDSKTAIKLLTWPNQRKCLRIANSYLK